MKVKMKTEKNYRVFLRNDVDGRIYCNDGKWREMAFIGNMSGCMKFWRKAGWAKKAAFGLEKYTITYLYDGDTVNCVGQVERK